TWPVNLIFILVIGGIYLGVFTPTEAAAIGMVGMGLIAYLRGGLTVKDFFECVTGAAVFSAMVFMILLGAEFFNGFLALSRMPAEAATMIQNSGMQPIMVLVTMVLIYLLLGCAMDSLAMILLTVPIFWPIISVLDFGMPANDVKIWFGIITLIVVEVGLITPPVGLNVFIINSMAKDTPMKETFKGVMPFLFTDLVRVILLITFPILALGLPHLL
ncbi:MAG: TRAP transporter large permease subunit, partial [Deltaproteobacteria bacterium]|nr:TRAP transporter large permease subunit [Deltaproteobacteria bacterium]